MTYSTKNTKLNASHLAPFAVGFDDLFDRLVHQDHQLGGFPPYNIRKKTDTDFSIDLAVAGLSESDLDISLKDNQLTIKSNWDENDTIRGEGEFLHQGISFKKFTRTFTVAEDIEVRGANLVNGLLTIQLERIIPEEKKTKSIKINSRTMTSDSRSLLNENATGRRGM